MEFTGNWMGFTRPGKRSQFCELEHGSVEIVDLPFFQIIEDGPVEIVDLPSS